MILSGIRNVVVSAVISSQYFGVGCDDEIHVDVFGVGIFCFFTLI